MEFTTVLAMVFVVAAITVALYAANTLLFFLLPSRMLAPAPEEDEAPEEADGTVYTAAFENYWIWDTNKRSIPGIFHSDRVKPVAFAAWQAAFEQAERGGLR